MIVDGFDSILTTGGFNPPAGAAADEIHQTVIGHLGTGVMNILNGGQVFTDLFDNQFTNANLIGAVIGGDPFLQNQDPDPGGEGTVTLAGADSRWFVTGTLQIGSFDDEDGPFGPNTDQSEGDNVEYLTSIGRGTLNIGEGTSVSVLPVDPENESLKLRLVLGRFGRINMTGGKIIVGANIGDPTIGARNDLSKTVSRSIRGASRAQSPKISKRKSQNGSRKKVSEKKLSTTSSGTGFSRARDTGASRYR